MSRDADRQRNEQPVTRAINVEHERPASFVGSEQPRDFNSNPLVPQIDLSSAHHFFSAQDLAGIHTEKYSRDRYARDTNQNARQLEAYFERLHPGFRCLTFSSGMGAIATCLSYARDQGFGILYQPEMYRKTRKLLDGYQGGVQVASTTITSLLESAEKKDDVALFLELPSNPHLRLPPDLEQLRNRPDGLLIMADLTLAGLGRVSADFLESLDLFVISLTKYIGGHNDALGGVVLMREPLYAAIWEERTALGTIMHPLDAFFFFRSLRTFDLRFNHQCNSATQILGWLANTESTLPVDRIYFPGAYANASQEQSMEWFSSQRGSVFSIEPRLTRDTLASRQADLRFIKVAPSFGSVDTLLEIPSLMSRPSASDSELLQDGLAPNLVRVSIGLEPAELIMRDLEMFLHH